MLRMRTPQRPAACAKCLCRARRPSRLSGEAACAGPRHCNAWAGCLTELPIARQASARPHTPAAAAFKPKPPLCACGLAHTAAPACCCCRTDNLFQSLEERTLTEEEQRIIEQRVRRCSAAASAAAWLQLSLPGAAAAPGMQGQAACLLRLASLLQSTLPICRSSETGQGIACGRPPLSFAAV